jgi:hypothetical protein
MKNWMAAIEKAIAMAQEEEQLDPDIEPKQLAFEINSIFFGANFSWQLCREKDAIARAWTAIEWRLEALRITPSKQRRRALR